MCKSLLIALASIGLTSLTGCASIVDGTSQSISVNTGSVTGASCELVNTKGRWFIPQTPGSTMVHKDYDDLNVTCEKDGKRINRKFSSTTKPIVAGNVVFGLIGGAIGTGVDTATGAAYDYPQSLYLPLDKQA